jgi:hypothetical protein
MGNSGEIFARRSLGKEFAGAPAEKGTILGESTLHAAT